MYQFKYTYSNGVEEFSRIFTLEEIEQGLQFDEVSDSLLLKDYKIIGRKLIENIEVIGYSNTFTEASSLSSKIKDNKLKARNKAIEDAISYIANKIRECVKGGNNNCFIWQSIAFGVWRYDIEEVVYSLLKDRGYILNNTPDAGGFNINIPN